MLERQDILDGEIRYYALCDYYKFPFPHGRSQAVYKAQDICILEKDTYVLAITIGETETNRTNVSLKSGYQYWLL
jgi:hypothetical protein